MTTRSPAHWTTQLGALAAHPAALLIVAGYGTLWFVLHRESFGWEALATHSRSKNGVASLAYAIWSMTLFIQRADRRDTHAVHAKLDELLKATREARTELAQIDEQEPEDIEDIRDHEKHEAEKSGRKSAA